MMSATWPDACPPALLLRVTSYVGCQRSTGNALITQHMQHGITELSSVVALLRRDFEICEMVILHLEHLS